MAWQNWFIPHKETHQKAHLVSWEGLLIYILLFILLQVSFTIIGFAKPGVLGISGNIDQKVLIELTNAERQKKGLSPVKENAALNNAAAMKAQNMFAENYWAHFAPSGKSPWDFILGAGYKFTFAGENLAKNFTNSTDVVNAWMASPTHRDNLLNSNYQDIGIAVVEGVLNGQKTILVVQEFGSTRSTAAKPAVAVQGKKIEVPPVKVVEKPLKPALTLAATETKELPKPIIDPFQVYRSVGFAIVFLIVILLSIDLWALRKRGVFRISSHHIAHMALLSLAAGSLWFAGPGSIL